MESRSDISLEAIRDLLAADALITPDDATVQLTEVALLAHAQSFSKHLSSDVRAKILHKMAQLNHFKKNRRPFGLDALPLLDASANFLDWAEAVKGIEPPADFDNIYLHSLESNEKRELFIAWVREYVPEEVHHDLLESFILLEGTCECDIWEENRPDSLRKVRMQEGDFMEMNIGELHHIKITSIRHAKAILQWLKI